MEALFIIFDRLPYGMLGCYGNTEVQTLGFDKLAAEGTTFDLCFTTSPHVNGTLPGFTDAIAQLASRGTDIRIIVEEGGEGAAQFTATHNAASYTTIPASGQALADRFDQALQQLPNCRPTAERRLTIVSLTGIRDEPIVHPLNRMNAFLSEADHLVARHLDRTQRESTNEQQMLLVTATTGIQGIGGDDPALIDPLRDSNVHVPLLARTCPSSDQGVRCDGLVTLGDVTATLLDWFGCEGISGEGSRSLLPRIRGQESQRRAAVIVHGPDGRIGIRTPEWYLSTHWDADRTAAEQRTTAMEAASLFRKPEDQWDILDVAAGAPQVVERLVEELAEALATNFRSPSIDYWREPANGT